MPEYTSISEDIFTVSEFFTPAECNFHIQRCETAGFEDAPINTLGGAVIAKDVRNNTRAMIDDIDLAGKLWNRILEFVPEMERWKACGLNERFRYYRYEPGQSFRWHRDGYFERSNGERSRLTFMVYLNDDFEGGDTKFEQIVVQPEKGMALGFTHHLWHEGAEVLSGQKYVLRTDVMYVMSEKGS